MSDGLEFDSSSATKPTPVLPCDQRKPAGGFRVGLLLMIGVSAGPFACILALPAQSLHGAQELAPKS